MALVLPVAVWLCVGAAPPAGGAGRGRRCGDRRAGGGCAYRGRRTGAVAQTGATGDSSSIVSRRALHVTVSLIGYTFVRRQVDVVAGASTELTIPLGGWRVSETVSVTPAAATVASGAVPAGARIGGGFRTAWGRRRPDARCRRFKWRPATTFNLSSRCADPSSATSASCSTPRRRPAAPVRSTNDTDRLP
jgi:hypothetical protein